MSFAKRSPILFIATALIAALTILTLAAPVRAASVPLKEIQRKIDETSRDEKSAQEDAPKKALSVEEFIELCGKGTPEDITAAIKNGADVNAKCAGGFTPIMMGRVDSLGGNRFRKFNADHSDIVKNAEAIKWVVQIIRAGEPNTVVGAEFLKLCANGTQEEILSAIKDGANVNARNMDNFYSTPLIASVHRGFPDIVSATHDATASPNGTKSKMV
jgi:hypothetical protein